MNYYIHLFVGPSIHPPTQLSIHPSYIHLQHLLNAVLRTVVGRESWMTLPQASSLSPHSERRSEGDRPPPLRCTLGGDKQLDKMVHGSLSSGILSVPSLGSAEWRRREVDPPSGGIPPPLRGVSAQKCRLPEAVPPVLPQSSTKVPLWAAAQAARASGLRVTHPLAISFVRLAGSLLEAGSGLRVGRGAGRGRGLACTNRVGGAGRTKFRAKVADLAGFGVQR